MGYFLDMSSCDLIGNLDPLLKSTLLILLTCPTVRHFLVSAFEVPCKDQDQLLAENEAWSPMGQSQRKVIWDLQELKLHSVFSGFQKPKD